MPPEPKPLLEPVGTANIPATTGRFVAKDRFVLDTSATAKTRISYLGDKFKAWFLDKIEEPFAGSTLRSFKLRESSLDGPIIAELGGEVRAETTLAEVYALIERQKSGESGILLTNGWANIFYVRDSTGVLRAVFVDWYGAGWHVRASAVSDPRRWDDGRRVFSRSSCPSTSVRAVEG